MQQVSKETVPEFFTEFKRKNKPKKWEDLKPIISKLNPHMLAHEQDSRCPYCEKNIFHTMKMIKHRQTHTLNTYSHNRIFQRKDSITIICSFLVLAKAAYKRSLKLVVLTKKTLSMKVFSSIQF